MAWCERKGIGYLFGLASNSVLLRQVGRLAEDAALGRLAGEGEKVRRYSDFGYAAKSWTAERRVIARIEVGPQGDDSRFTVTNLPGSPKSLYKKLYCARGQAEDLIRSPCRARTPTRPASPLSPAKSASCRRRQRGGYPRAHPSAQPQTPTASATALENRAAAAL
jgi:Transposase DDE domain group 1